ncbi:MAG: crossover junction endodeoxyribonuclease RuvC [Bacteroidetes bacterium]|nr:crossover junction endodeoxyribonuclease RuvC [Bacteroidota bacterium]MBS1649773.1 crossover junction endodeoxyribonuclease RuvC [Bacteroidota bacterium]
MKPKIILGIDPGTQLMGYALLKIQGNTLQVLLMDVLKLTAHKDVYERLEKIHTKVCELIKLYQPHTFAIEAPFFGKNVQSMLKLGRAQGVAIAAAMQAGIDVTEYSPKKIKQSITGNGNADKEQVWKMLQQILFIEKKPQYFDATDALAVALCHHYQSSSALAKLGKGFKGWDDFIKKNPGRIK